jgi:lysophospholipase L1-like esterase
VQWVILLEGVNDINLQGAQDGPNALTAEQLIWGYQQIIARCHMRGIRVMGATIMPEEGVWIVTERTERLRQEVNRWIRTKGNFDAIVDFDAAVRDPDHPSKLKAQFNPGDNIHPNDAGNQAMAAAVDISVFER